MTRASIVATALAAILVGAGAAQALEVTRSGAAAEDAAALWARIGPFCAIGDWHPAVATCAESEEDGATVRTLALEGGGTIKERLIETTDLGYTYEILESPLPVANYRSTIGVAPDGDGATINWTGTFDAKDASDADAEAAIAGIYESGIAAIAAP